MSLKVWLPLTGDLHNQGISDYVITSTNSSAVTNGKIGSCMKITSTTLLGYTPNFNTNSLSFGGWFKFNQAEIAAKVDTLTYTSTKTTPTGNLIGNTSYGGIGLIWVGNNHYTSGSFNSMAIFATLRTSSVNQSTSSFTVEFDKWIHIMVTWNPDTHILSLYKNGALVNSKTFNAFTDGVSRVLQLDWAAIYGGNGPSASIPIYCNDVRIYDHCLSAAEVREISQGLVLHYKLDSFQGGYGNPNLITNFDTSFLSYADGATTLFTNQMSSGTQEIISNFANSSKCLHLHSNGGSNRQYRTFSATANKTYTISADYYSTTTQATAWRGELNGGDYSWFGATGGTYDTPGVWKRMSYTYSNLTSNATIFFFIYCTNGTDCYVKNIKIEEGSSATTWGPSGSSTTTIQDSSGYGYNGTINSNPAISSETARYNYSMSFDGIDDCIKIPFNDIIKDRNYTVSVWTYKTSIGTKNYQTILGGPSGFELEARSASSTSPVYRLHNWGGGITAYEFNKWNLFTFVHTDSNSKLYVNGDLKITGTSASIPTGNYYIGAWNSVTGQNYEGLMSDFRIYCTALSADDILQLYHTGAKIDNLNAMHTYEFKEEASNMLFPVELSRTNLTFSNGLGKYTQANCQVTLTDQGYRIYRPPNVLNSANGGSNNMWGGLKIVNQVTDKISLYDTSNDNNLNLQVGHTYIFAFHAKGQSSNPSVQFSWSNNMGYSGRGLNPDSTIIVQDGIPENFQGEKDCVFIFTINDTISKICTTTYSSYVKDSEYLSYRHLVFRWDYTNTGELGTDIYITDLRMYDITSYMAKITKQGQARFYDFVEQITNCKIRRNSELLTSQLIEI